MTESDWFNSTDPQAMLAFVQGSGKASDRKLILFAAGCCRRIWGLLNQIGTAAVEVAERHADGLVNHKERASMENLAWWGADGLNYEEEHIWWAGWAAHAAVDGNAANAAILAARASRREDEPFVQSDLLRDTFGPSPFRPSTPLSPSLPESQGGLVVGMANAIYEERSLPEGTLDLVRLAVLADALEEAGADSALLDHLRRPGPHFRGCFVIDLLTSRK